MNKHLPILSLLCLFCIFLSKAQDLKEFTIAGKAKKLDSDLVARLDQNGDYCAAIQVISDMDGFSYDSNDGIVGAIDDKAGKDIVYLTASERVLEILKTGYKPLKIILSEQGIKLKPRQVWQITLSGEEKEQTLPVNFLIQPKDAIFTIDGEVANFEGSIKLVIGEHDVTIEKDGYQTINELIEINESQTLFNWTMDKQQDAGLQITTEPPGANVYLDEVNLGQTPIAVFYPPGSYQLKVMLDGYVPIENETLEVKLPQTQKTFTLEENAAYLTVNANPGAKVYFNDELIDNPQRVKLSPKVIMVKVSMPKAETMERQVVLNKNDDLSLDMFLDIETGTIQVAVTPFGADIELTGDAGEYYTATGMKIFENIPVGKYNLKVSSKGYEIKEEIITLSDGEKVSKRIELEILKKTPKNKEKKDPQKKSKFQLGPIFGINYSKFNYSSAPDMDSKIGFQVGIQYNYDFNMWALRLETCYKLMNKELFDVQDSLHLLNDFSYLSFPFSVLVYPDKKESFFMQFGLSFDYYSAAINNTKVDNFIDIGALVGIGISIPINKNSVDIELQYIYGVSDYSKYFGSIDEELINTSMVINMSYLFGFN